LKYHHSMGVRWAPSSSGRLTTDCLVGAGATPVAGGDSCGVVVGSGSAVWVAGVGSVGKAATVASVLLPQAATANTSSNEARAKVRVGAARRVSNRPRWLGKVIAFIIPRK
jgi:hypothetical protein